MLLTKAIICSYLLIFLSTSGIAQISNNSFRWGVNGHPLTQSDYNKTTWDKQISFLKELNLNTYRVDVMLDTQGLPKNEYSFQELNSKLNSNSISMFPVLIITGLSGLDAGQIYTQCYNQGKAFGLKYGNKFPWLEVGNEEDNKVIASGNGIKASDYNDQKIPNVMAKLKGFIDGLKSVSPDIKVSISFGWVHFYYLELLKQNNVNYDIIGYHWYSNMGGGDITNVHTPFVSGNLLKSVSDKFNKEIWITEFNYYRGTKNGDYTKQADYISQSIKSIISQNIIKGFFIYELFDQSASGQRSPNEANYGLVMKQDANSDYTKKEVYTRYQSLINDYKK